MERYTFKMMNSYPEELRALIPLRIPEAKPKVNGFLEIVDQAEKENPTSNVYRYFLDQELSHQLSSILLDALFELISMKTGGRHEINRDDFRTFGAFREVPTNKGRIDILITSNDGQSAIIIESKIHHELVNDLKDYWESTDARSKQGIVLSLRPMHSGVISHNGFINITHYEWLTRAISKGLPHDLGLREFIYFNDFVTSMTNLTSMNQLTPEIEFYIQHHTKVDAAIKARTSAVRFIHSQLKLACDRLGWEVYGAADEWKNLWNPNFGSEIYLTLYPIDILKNPGKVDIILETYTKGMKFEKEIRQKFENDWSSVGFQTVENKESWYRHLAKKTYDFPANEMESISNFICEWIEKEIEPVRREIAKYLDTKGVK